MIITDLTPDADLFEPLLVNSNATITVALPAPWIVDPTTGNLVEDTSAQPTQDIRAILKRASQEVQLVSGGTKQEFDLIGYLVDPKELPDGVANRAFAEIELDDTKFFGLSRAGRCQIFVPPQNPFVGVDLGTKVTIRLIED